VSQADSQSLRTDSPGRLQSVDCASAARPGLRGGFLLEDAPPAQLLNGIRTVAGGAALRDRVQAVVYAYRNGLVV
jgi:hypothetical protein